MNRRQSTKIHVGSVPIGGNSVITVQTMTNTITTDIEATINQIKSVEQAGADMVRVAIPNAKSAEAIKTIKSNIRIPLIADVHFNYRLAIKSAEYGADCLRFNPGNINDRIKIKNIVQAAKYHCIPIRIGINSGSLERDVLLKHNNIATAHAMAESALRNIEYLYRLNFNNFKVSVKSSDVVTTINAYRMLAKKIDNPFHIGITESGNIQSGTVKSSIGIGTLLLEGIGDTIRVSLSADPIQEIKIGYDILRSLNIRNFGIDFVSCPTCSRKEFDVINVVNELEKKLCDIKTSIKVSIIGCTVNGIGEALKSNVGVVGGYKSSSVYINGIKQNLRLNNNEIVTQTEKLIRNILKCN